MQRKLLESPSALTLFALSCSVLMVLHQAAVLWTAYSGHDQAWYLIAAQRVLNGAQLYGPFVSDTNPPMIVWFSTLPVLLSHVVPIAPMLCLRLVVLALWLGSAAWSMMILKRDENVEPPVCALVVLIVLSIGLRMIPQDFGQREHLFVVFALPYLFAMCAHPRARRNWMERCAIGIAAGCAVCFKPQDALVLISAELVVIIARRSLRRWISPELLSLVATCGLYFVVVRIATPQYTSQVVPLLLETYWAYGTSSALGLLLAMKLWLVCGLALIAASLLFLRKSPLSLTVAVFGASSVGALLAYAQQRADWTYHRYPIWAFLILAVCLFGLQLSQSFLLRWQGPVIGRPLAWGCLVGMFVVGVGLFPRQIKAMRPQRSEVYQFLRPYKDGRTVLVLSTAVFWVADVADLKLKWGARFPCLPFLPAIIRSTEDSGAGDKPFKRLSSEELASISSLQRKEIAKDLNHFQPSVVLVEHCDKEHSCQAIEGKSLDMIGWFLEDQQFQEAWKHYRRQPDGPTSFDVYERK